MKLNPITGKNFKTILCDLNFHDCTISKITQTESNTLIDIDYYNWEDTDTNPTAKWYTLRLTIIKLIVLEFYNPDPGVFSYDIGSWEFDTQLNKSIIDNQTCFSINDDIDKEDNYLDILFYTHSSRDIEFGYNGYIKILGFNNSIEILNEHNRKD